MATLNIDLDNLPHRAEFEKLLQYFKQLGKALVAYSGGVDSTLLLKVGAMALGAQCLGVTARSETLTDDEFDAAMDIALDHGLRIETIEYSELEIENYADNTPNRCYFCKHELFSKLQPVAAAHGITAIIDGTNADDVGDWRPGMKAASELKVLSPLKECGITKAQVRELSKALGLPNWDKPSMPCLSSRVAYGIKIDKKKLEQIAAGEKFLRQNGFRQVRVRHHEQIARIEVSPEEINRLLEPELRTKIAAKLLELGFRYVTVDLIGYRTGSLNEGVVKPVAQV